MDEKLPSIPGYVAGIFFNAVAAAVVELDHLPRSKRTSAQFQKVIHDWVGILTGPNRPFEALATPVQELQETLDIGIDEARKLRPRNKPSAHL